jgi:transposase
MSKARLVITAVTVEKRPVSEVAKSYGVARSWIYELLDRYRAEGDAAFEPRSRRPKTSPTAISAETAELITRLRKELAGQGLDAGPQTIAWHLEQHHRVKVSPATLSRRAWRPAAIRNWPSSPSPPATRQAAGSGRTTPSARRDHRPGHRPPAAICPRRARRRTLSQIRPCRSHLPGVAPVDCTAVRTADPPIRHMRDQLRVLRAFTCSAGRPSSAYRAILA